MAADGVGPAALTPQKPLAGFPEGPSTISHRPEILRRSMSPTCRWAPAIAVAASPVILTLVTFKAVNAGYPFESGREAARARSRRPRPCFSVAARLRRPRGREATTAALDGPAASLTPSPVTAAEKAST